MRQKEQGLKHPLGLMFARALCFARVYNQFWTIFICINVSILFLTFWMILLIFNHCYWGYFVMLGFCPLAAVANKFPCLWNNKEILAVVQRIDMISYLNLWFNPCIYVCMYVYMFVCQYMYIFYIFPDCRLYYVILLSTLIFYLYLYLHLLFPFMLYFCFYFPLSTCNKNTRRWMNKLFWFWFWLWNSPWCPIINLYSHIYNQRHWLCG